MSPRLNFYPVELKEETLKVWSNPSLSGQAFHNLKGEGYDNIYFKRKSNRNYAIPFNDKGKNKLPQLGFRPTKAIPTHIPKLFGSLVKHGFVRHLLKNGVKENGNTFTLRPLYYRESDLDIYNFDRLFKSENPLYEFEELQLIEGFEIQSYYYNLIPHGFVIGLTLSYTTTYHFTAGIDTLLNGINLNKMPDFYVQRKIPPECDENCALYDESRLLGKFAGFADRGKGCKEADKYVQLQGGRVDFNVPATRVVFERKPPLIKRWGELQGKKNLIKKIRERKGLTTDESTGTSSYARFRYNKIARFRTGIEELFSLPNGQNAIIDESLKLEVEERMR